MDINFAILEADKQGKTPAFCYDRVSTLDQAQHGHSLSYQQDAAQIYAARKNLHIVHTFTAAESARRGGERKVFHQMLELALRHKIKHLIFSQVDRMSRNYKDLVKIEDLVEHEDFFVHFYHSNMVLHKKSLSHEKFMFHIQMTVAKNVSDQISEKVNTIVEYRASQGVAHCGHPPYGYRYDKTERKFIKDPAAEKTLQTIFDLYDGEQISIQELVDFLNSHGYTTSKGGPWNTSTAHRILTNVFYTGQFVRRGETLQGSHAAYISLDRFSRRMARMGVRYVTKRGGEFLLKGMLRSGETGRMMVGQAQSGAHNSGEYVYYTSPRPVYVSLREDRILDMITAAVENLTFDRAFKDRIMEIFTGVVEIKDQTQEEELAFIARRIGKLESENRWLLERLKEGFDPTTVKDEMRKNRELIDNLEGQRKKLRINKEQFIFKVSDCMEACRCFAVDYLAADNEHRVGLLKHVIEKILVFKDRVELVFEKPFSFIFDPEIMNLRAHDLGAADVRVMINPARGGSRDEIITPIEKMAENWILWLAA